jgi:hypothetical protein
MHVPPFGAELDDLRESPGHRHLPNPNRWGAFDQ